MIILKMDLISVKPKLFYLSTLFLLINIFQNVLCLLEFPLTVINSTIIPKYKEIILDNEIPSYIKEILDKNKNISKSKNIKIFTESSKIKLISNNLFIAKIKLGSSEQEFNLILDTGSSMTWVPMLNSKDLYRIQHHYDPKNSTSSKKLKETFNIKYGSGSCEGNFYTDKMKYIKDKEFDIDFGVAKATDFPVDGADGIIGLSRLYEDNSKSFIHMLCRGRITTSKIFSFKLGLNLSENSGKFYIGKHDDFNKNNVATCEMINSNYYEKNLWACEMTSFSIINYDKTIKLRAKKKISVIFDSGTNVIFLPLSYLEDIQSDLSKMNCQAKKIFGERGSINYQLVCLKDTLPDFNFVIGGHTFILPGEYFFYYYNDYSISKIIFQDSIQFGDNLFIIGSPFFMLFHILFDSYTQELHFYPEKDEFLIKGSWWNLKHIIIVILLILLFICFIIIIILIFFWKKKNKLDSFTKESFDINSYLGLIQ